MSAGTASVQASALSQKDEICRAARSYLLVGLILFFGTGLTVAIATVPWMDVGGHGFDRWDALLGISIASIKAFLVAAIFMHLNHERRLIYALAALAAIHCIGMFVGIYWHFADMIWDPHFYHSPIEMSTDAVGRESS